MSARSNLALTRQAFESDEQRYDLLVELGDTVLGWVSADWLGHASDVRPAVKRINVVHWRDGVMSRFGFYDSVEEALAAGELGAEEARAWPLVERALDVVDAVNSRDVERGVAAFHPEAEVRPALLGLVDGVDVLRGADGVRTWFENAWTVFEEFENRPLEVRWAGDRGVMLVRVLARGRGSGLDIDAEAAYTVVTSGGLLRRLETFLQPADAYAALGFSR